VILLPVLAGHPVLAAIDRDVDVRHRPSALRLAPFHHGMNGFYCMVEPARDLAASRVEALRPRSVLIDFGRQARPVGTERSHLGRQGRLAAVGVAAPVQGRIQPFQGGGEPACGGFNGAGIAHASSFS
jgi:hypothetical protein